MNVKAKTSFIIVFTLLIGIVVGGLAHRIIVQKRIQRAFSVRNPDSLVSMYERTVNPDSNQANQLREILNKHAKTVAEIRSDFQEEMFSANESLHEELNQILTPDQKKRLESRLFRPRRHLQREKQRPFKMQPVPFLMADMRVFKERLSLSDEQAQRFQDILMKLRFRREMRPREERNMMGFVRWWKEREKAMDKALIEILTEEQKEIYAQLKQEHREKIIKMITE